MNALTIRPGKVGSTQLLEIAEPPLSEGQILCEMLMVGVCGTDFEISEGKYGSAPVGAAFLVLGHESLGRVIEAPASSQFKKGDLLAGFVRRPDPVPCANCAVGEWDMCRNDQFRERGIKELNGFASERFRVPEEFAIKLDPRLESVGVLLEPTSVVAKAWEQTLRISSRSAVAPRRALITGAGPVGLLAALIGVQKGLEIHVLDRILSGPKVELVKALGATYHGSPESLASFDFDITIECTGSTEMIFKLFNQIQSDGILCLAGVSSGGRSFPTDIGKLNLDIVLKNETIFGSVNANRRHYEEAARVLEKADLRWLSRLITRRVKLKNWQEAFTKKPDDIKVVLTP
jgi:threonine dehydrogenase-like Zn-dependent dehydrogenase